MVFVFPETGKCVTNVTKRTRLLIFFEKVFEFLTKTVRNSMYKCFSE